MDEGRAERNTEERRELSRRGLLAAGLGVVGAGVVAPGWLSRGASAQGARVRAAEGGAERAAAVAANTLSPRRFTVAVVPDVQYLFDFEQDRGDARPLVESFEWLVANAEERDIVFVASVGDLTEHGATDEMEGVGTVYEILEEAGMGYSVLAGNHDINGRLTDAQRPGTPYLDFFGPDRVGGQPTFGGADATGYNTFHVFSGAGREWLLLALDWRMSEASYVWAQRAIDRHPTLPVILTTHELVGDLGGGVAGLSGYGRTVWDRLIDGNDQVFMALGGHYWPVARATMQNAAGHDVQLDLANYQERYYGGAGIVRLYSFDLDEGTVDVESFSPWAERAADGGNPLARNVARPTRAGERAVDQFSVAIDFDARFASFAPERSRSERGAPVVRNSLVRGTVAYWRLGDPGGGRSQDGFPVRPRSLRDLSGNGNHLRTVRLPGAADLSLAYRDADDPDQPGAGSLQFSGARAGTYLRTVEGAPMDDATFPDGYTIEVFVRLPGPWGGDQAWMGVLSRLATGADAGKTGGWNPRAPAATLSLSPSRQVQWEMFPTNLDGTLTNWSYELETQVWRHVAVVNDGRRTRMFIDGAPILRSPRARSVGIAGEGNSWLVGASHFDHNVDKSFTGWLGDVRIVERALAPHEWLTRRPD